MKTCAALLTILLLGDAALTAVATESLGLMVAVVSWLLLYSLLAGALSKSRRGLRWFILFAGFGIGCLIDYTTDRGFHWFTGIAAVAAAGHFAGWAGAVDLLFGNGRHAQVPTPLGRPGYFNTSFAASILLAYLCQTTASGLDTRTGLICAFAAVVSGLITWELGRSVKGRHATVGKKNSANRILRWLAASVAATFLFLLFAQVLPIAAEQATRVTSLQVSGDSFDLPDMPDLDTSDFRNGQIKPAQLKPQLKNSSSIVEPVESLEGLSGGFRQEVSGGAPESAIRLQEFEGGEATANDSSGAIATSKIDRPQPGVPELGSQPSSLTNSEVTETTNAFWSLPPALVWPFLILATLILGAIALIFVLVRSRPESKDRAPGGDGDRRPHWDHDFIPTYLRDFLARAAELGFEKERGQTLREFLRTLRRRGISNQNFPTLRDYHYLVQFDGARRNDSQERQMRRDSRKWVQ